MDDIVTKRFVRTANVRLEGRLDAKCYYLETKKTKTSGGLRDRNSGKRTG
jgi:hypothetical protein